MPSRNAPQSIQSRIGSEDERVSVGVTGCPWASTGGRRSPTECSLAGALGSDYPATFGDAECTRMSNELRLAPRDRLLEEVDWGDQTPRSVLDFEVDGDSLYDVVVRLGMDYISPLWLDADAAEQTGAVVERLLGAAPADLPGSRVAVFVCPECLDLGCGAVTVERTITDQRVRWANWAHQTDDDQTLDTSEVSGSRDLEFDRAAYERTLHRPARIGRVTAASRDR